MAATPAAGAAAAGAPAGSTAVLNVAIVGWGLSARTFHLPLLQSLPKRFKLTHVVVRTAPLSVPAPEGVVVVTALADVLSEAANVQLIVLCTPSDVHYEQAKQVLAAGKHCVVEKPFTTTVAEAVELDRLAKAAGVVLSVFHNRRWDADFLTLQEVLAQGLLGQVMQFESHFDRYRTFTKPGWREVPGRASGILYDLAPHLVDQAVQLFGEPSAVTCHVLNQRPTTVTDDAFDLTLHFDDKPYLRCQLAAGMVVRVPGPRMEVHGMSGSFVKYGLDPQENDLRAGKIPVQTAGWGTEPKDSWAALTTTLARPGGPKLEIHAQVESVAGNWVKFYENVGDAVQGIQPLAVTADQAIITAKVVEAAFMSSTRRCTINLRDIATE